MPNSENPNFGNFSPEFAEKWSELKREGERQIALFRKSSLERINEVLEVMEDGYFPLHELISVIATARPIKGLKALSNPPPREMLGKLEAERLDAYRIGLRRAKKEAQEGRLVVRHFSTFFPVNDDPRIIAWCDNDESQVSSVEEMRPPIDLVVSITDARGWFERMSIPFPAWLNKSNTQKNESRQPADGDSSSAVQSLIYERLLKSVAAFPSAFPDYETSPPKINNAVRPWLKDKGFAANDKEAHVFGAVIRDHFKLSGDTQD